MQENSRQEAHHSTGDLSSPVFLLNPLEDIKKNKSRTCVNILLEMETLVPENDMIMKHDSGACDLGWLRMVSEPLRSGT